MSSMLSIEHNIAHLREVIDMLFRNFARLSYGRSQAIAKG